MNPHDSRTLTVKFSKSMDLFIMRYSTNTVREHPTENSLNASGYNGVFFKLNQVIPPKTKFPLMNPYDYKTQTVKFSKSIDLFIIRYSTNTFLKPY